MNLKVFRVLLCYLAFSDVHCSLFHSILMFISRSKLVNTRGF